MIIKTHADQGQVKIKDLSFQKRMLFILLCVLWTQKTLVTAVLVILRRIPLIGVMFEPSIVIPVIVLILVALSFKEIGRVRMVMIVIYFVFVAISLVTLLIGSNLNESFQENAANFLLECLPMIFVGNAAFNLLNEKISKRFFFILSELALFYLIVSHYVSGSRLQYDWSSNMYMAYLVLPHLLMIIGYTFDHKSTVGIVSAIIGTVYLVMQGTRGAVICLTFFLGFHLIRYIRQRITNPKVAMPLILALIVLAFVIVNYYDSLMLWLYSFARANGYSIRVFDFLTGSRESGTLDSGRIYLYNILIQAIKDHPLGYGLGADAGLSGFTYAHNFYLEIIIEFGVFVGGAISIVLTILILRTLFNKSIDWDCKSIILIIVTVGFVKLMLSGTYLTDPYFFVCVGMCIAASRAKSGVFSTTETRTTSIT